MSANKTKRREFLASTGLLAGGGWLAMNAPMLMAAGQDAADRMAAGAGWTHLTPEQAETLAAVVDQIIPPDDTPGAAETGVVYFIDKVLGGFMSGNEGMLKQGLAEVSATQSQAADLAARFERGEPGLELSQVMLESQKASVAFRATVEVRNASAM